jgi:hypothetical protein
LVKTLHNTCQKSVENHQILARISKKNHALTDIPSNLVTFNLKAYRKWEALKEISALLKIHWRASKNYNISVISKNPKNLSIKNYSKE